MQSDNEDILKIAKSISNKLTANKNTYRRSLGKIQSVAAAGLFNYEESDDSIQPDNTVGTLLTFHTAPISRTAPQGEPPKHQLLVRHTPDTMAGNSDTETQQSPDRSPSPGSRSRSHSRSRSRSRSKSGSRSRSHSGSRSRSRSDEESRSRSRSHSGSRSRSGSISGSRSRSRSGSRSGSGSDSGSDVSDNGRTARNTNSSKTLKKAAVKQAPAIVTRKLRYKKEPGYREAGLLGKPTQVPYLEDTKDKEFWLVHAPADFGGSIINGKAVVDNTKMVVCREDKGRAERLWEVQSIKGVPGKGSRLTVLLPSKKDDHLHAAGHLEGQMVVSCTMPLLTYTIPKDSNTAPKLPTGLKLRNIPFGSGAPETILPAHSSSESRNKRKRKRSLEILQDEEIEQVPEKHKKKKKKHKKGSEQT